MKIVISPVGFQDPHSSVTNSEGSALTVCRRVGPAVVYLLPTAERADASSHTMRQAEETREWLNLELPGVKVFIRPLDVSDPTDYDRLLPEMERVVRRILEETAELAGREFWLNASSGTPQIKTAGLMMIASGLLPARALQVANPEATRRADRLQEVDVAFLNERQTIEKVGRLFERHLFGACVAELEQLASTSFSANRRLAAGALGALCAGYAAIDRVQYHDAVDRLQHANRVMRGTREFAGVQGVLDRQADVAKALSRRREQEDFLSLADIYHNAERRLAEENYADVLARVWRLVEGTLYVWLRQRYGIDPANLPKSRDRSQIQRLGPPNATRTMGLAACIGALRDTFQDPQFTAWLRQPVPAEAGPFDSWQPALEDLRKRRNDSMVAHGVRPVDHETARRGLALARSMLPLVFPGEQIDDYPFARAHLLAIGKVALDLAVS